MAHLDVYPMPGGARCGYVVDVQANLLAGLATRAVVPADEGRDSAIGGCWPQPVFSIKGQRHVLLTQGIAAVPARELREAVGSLLDQRETILRALDLLLTGV
ncbi:MAG TPA: CcdB family protein [Acetobacteraceae bacterium]|nr:CcdB family protein [Acetobacteraceae bacterium]